MTAARPYALAHSDAILSPMKTRHQFYLPDGLSDALHASIDRKAALGLDARFGPKLDRLVTHADPNRHGLESLTEMLALFIQLPLTLVAHQPPLNGAARRLGEDKL